MRIGILSFPMLFQRDSELQQQVRATIHALERISAHRGRLMTVARFDPLRDQLAEIDLLHVFSATHGNDRIVALAAEAGLPVVLTPLISAGWTEASGHSARAGERGFGNLTAWNVPTGYAQTRRALQQANLIVALGEAEKQAIAAGFLVDGTKVKVVPNGISPHFFDADGALFRLRTGIAGPFALMTGAISPSSQALAAAISVAELGLPLVLVGEARERDQEYLRQVRAVRGVTCLGGMAQDAPMLASAYAAASVFLQPGLGAPYPQGVLAALAAGTPVVMAASTAPALPGSALAVAQVAPGNRAALQEAIAALLGAPPAREHVRALVQGRTWQRLADQIAACYAALLEAPEPQVTALEEHRHALLGG